MGDISICNEGQPLSVSAAYTIDCLLTLVLRSLLAGGVIARPGMRAKGERAKKKKSDRIGRRARAEVLAAILCRVRDGYDVRKNIDSFDSVDIL